MKRYQTLLLLFLVIGLIQAACNMPTGPNSTGFPTFMVTPVLGQGTGTPPASGTPAAPSLATVTPTGGTVPSTGDGNCTYAMSFISDVTIPDDTTLKPGEAFTKTWRVRNDGTCTWGPQGYNLHALAFTGGDQLGAPDQVPLPGVVKPGQTADVSVNMVAPTTPGTYTSSWKLRIDNDPNGNGPYLGIGDKKTDPLYVRIKVGS